MPKMILDVDTGIDDSLALLYLLASPEAEILAITCTAGNVPARQVAINNLAWLELFGPAGSAEPEVALGAEVPILEPLRTTEETHGPQGIGYAELPVPTRGVSSRHATQVWIDVVRAFPGEVIGLVTGPLTNLALALSIEPELPRLLRRLVVMGGALNHPGNTFPTAEWNVSVDPESAKIVFDAFSGLPADRRPILCPLDITERVEMRPRHVARLAELAGCEAPELLSADDEPGTRSRASNELVRYVSDAVRFYMEFHLEQGQGWLAHMHDPFAAAVALDPVAVTTTPAVVDVELAGTLTRGSTIADWRGMWGREPNVDVVTGFTADAGPESFFDDLVTRLAALARGRR